MARVAENILKMLGLSRGVLILRDVSKWLTLMNHKMGTEIERQAKELEEALERLNKLTDGNHIIVHTDGGEQQLMRTFPGVASPRLSTGELLWWIMAYADGIRIAKAIDFNKHRATDDTYPPKGCICTYKYWDEWLGRSVENPDCPAHREKPPASAVKRRPEK